MSYYEAAAWSQSKANEEESSVRTVVELQAELH